MAEKFVFVAWNKPVDYLVELPQQESIPINITPKSHLEKQDEGLIIMSDDPAWTCSEQEYEVTIDTALEKNAAMLLQKGMLINDVFYAGVTISHNSNRGKRSIISVIATQTDPRQLRHMFETLGYHIISLKCIRLDRYALGTLAPGQWKYLKK